MKKCLIRLIAALLCVAVPYVSSAATVSVIEKAGAGIIDLIDYANQYKNTSGSTVNGPGCIITQESGVAGKADDDVSILSTLPAIDSDDYSEGSTHKQWLDLSYTKSDVGENYFVVDINILPLNEETVREVLLQNGKSVSYTPAVQQYKHFCFDIGQWNNIRIVTQPSEGKAVSKYPYSYVYVNGELIAEGRSTASAYGAGTTYIYPYRVMFDAKKRNDGVDSSLYYDDFSVYLSDTNPGAPVMPQVMESDGYTVSDGVITVDGSVTVADLISDYDLKVFADGRYDTELGADSIVCAGNKIVAYNGKYMTTYSVESAQIQNGCVAGDITMKEHDNIINCSTAAAYFGDSGMDIMFVAAAYKDNKLLEVSVDKKYVERSSVGFEASLKKVQGAEYSCYLWSEQGLVPYCEQMYKGFESMDGKKIIFVGNSLLYYGQTVLNKSSLVQSVRDNDTGYFYQLCKENGYDVSVTNWTFGGHKLTDSLGTSCSQETKSCYGHNHLADLEDRNFDYVVLSSGSWEDEAAFAETIEYVTSLFREVNPDVKFIYAGHHRNHTLGKAGVLNYMKTLSDNGFLVYDWGKLIVDIMNGDVSVPGATQSYGQNSFIISKSAADGYHPNLLTGYITTLMTYCAITGESAVGQPYDFCNDAAINKFFDFESYKDSYYIYDDSSTTGVDESKTNFDSVFASQSDMRGIQTLIDKYLNECSWKTYNYTAAE